MAEQTQTQLDQFRDKIPKEVVERIETAIKSL